jgi:hypothetical protein
VLIRSEELWDALLTSLAYRHILLPARPHTTAFDFNRQIAIFPVLVLIRLLNVPQFASVV